MDPMPRTIAALSTVPGTSAVAVLRVSGPQVRAVLRHLCGKVPEERKASLVWLRDGEEGERIDQALVLFFPGPHSYTGEDLAELHVHGSRAVIGALLPLLAAQPGVRVAEPGEFTRRAFEAGRMSLPQVEGLGDLLAAETAEQRRQAVRGLGGEADRFFEALRGDLLLALAHVEARIEFPDEGDVADLRDEPLVAMVSSIRLRIESQLETFSRGARIREGLLIVIAGKPNAGKSSLLNLLAGSDLAIVSDEEGTTRDIVEVALDLSGVKVILADTAGLRQAKNLVEQEGVRRALHHVSQADLVLYLEDATGDSETLDEDYKKFCSGLEPSRHIWRLRNKMDLAGHGEGLSVRFGQGTDDLKTRLAHWAADQVQGEPPLVVHERQRRLLDDMVQALDAASGELIRVRHELAADHMNVALGLLGRITGHIGLDAMLDSLFGSFCIGK